MHACVRVRYYVGHHLNLNPTILLPIQLVSLTGMPRLSVRRIEYSDVWVTNLVFYSNFPSTLAACYWSIVWIGRVRVSRPMYGPKRVDMIWSLDPQCSTKACHPDWAHTPQGAYINNPFRIGTSAWVVYTASFTLRGLFSYNQEPCNWKWQNCWYSWLVWYPCSWVWMQVSVLTKDLCGHYNISRVHYTP